MRRHIYYLGPERKFEIVCTVFVNDCAVLVPKVILETCYLEELEIIKASELAIHSGADFIKTSTGFGTGGATVEDVKEFYNRFMCLSKILYLFQRSII